MCESVGFREVPERFAGKLRPVVTEEGLWNAVPRENALDGTDDCIRRRRPERYDLGVPRTVVHNEKEVLAI